MAVKVKICGLTDPDTALFAAQAGADAVGFIFADGPRRVEVEKARAICTELPPFVVRVGVFVNEARDVVRETAAACGLTALQFHGDEDAGYCRGFVLPVLKAVRMRTGTDLGVLARFPAAGFILDSYDPLQAGGTGRAFSWELAVDRPPAPVILAGGLTPENVARAIRQVQPYGVDVSSGVETGGKKDLNKIRRFIEAVRRCG
jgi:phosphoribosylanthranilate isomerase